MGTYAIPWVCLIPVSNLASEERNGKVYPALFCLNWLIFAQKCKNTRESSERQLEVDSHLVDVGSSEELLQIPVRDVRAIQAWATGAREMNLLLHDRKVIVTGYLWCESRQRQPVSHQCPTMYPNNYWEPACYSKETKKNKTYKNDFYSQPIKKILLPLPSLLINKDVTKLWNPSATPKLALHVFWYLLPPPFYEREQSCAI